MARLGNFVAQQAGLGTGKMVRLRNFGVPRKLCGSVRWWLSKVVLWLSKVL